MVITSELCKSCKAVVVAYFEAWKDWGESQKTCKVFGFKSETFSIRNRSSNQLIATMALQSVRTSITWHALSRILLRENVISFGLTAECYYKQIHTNFNLKSSVYLNPKHFFERLLSFLHSYSWGMKTANVFTKKIYYNSYGMNWCTKIERKLCCEIAQYFFL